MWRCRVCEGVNGGGRVCATCGAEVPYGEPVRAAVRTRLPAKPTPAPPPVPPMPSRRELRSTPSPEEMGRVETNGSLSSFDGLDIVPLPGGCLVSFGQRR
jgi:hypothetical protein